MKYLCLVFFDEKKLNALSPQESQALIDEAIDHDEALRRQGYLLAAHPLQPVQTARTVRRQKGKIVVTDGPFAETKEQIGGFVLIEAANLDQAVQIASKLPPLPLGGVEVRPIMEMTHSAAKSAAR